jgi:hypothetical protein
MRSEPSQTPSNLLLKSTLTVALLLSSAFVEARKVDVDYVKNKSANCLSTPLASAPANAAKMRVMAPFNKAQFEAAFWYQPCDVGAVTRIKAGSVLMVQFTPIPGTGKSAITSIESNFVIEDANGPQKFSIGVNDDGVTDEMKIQDGPTSAVISLFYSPGRTEANLVPGQVKSIKFKSRDGSVVGEVTDIPISTTRNTRQ